MIHRERERVKQTDRQRKGEREGLTGRKRRERMREIDREKIRVITINKQLVNFNSSCSNIDSSVLYIHYRPE